MGKTRKPGWFCGSAVDLRRRTRAFAFLLLLLLSTSLCFSQFGIISCGGEAAGALSFVLFLVPVALCVTMLGIIPGVILAFLTGVAIMFRAQWTPTSAFDSHLADPFLSLVSIVIGAMLMAAVVIPVARRRPVDLTNGLRPWQRLGPARIVSIIVGGLLLAAAFSYGTRGLMYLIVTPGGAEYGYASIIERYLASIASPLVLLEAVLNAAVVSAACLFSVAFDAHRRSNTWMSSITSTFTLWLALAMGMVFMASSSMSFCTETMRGIRDADAQLVSELEYLQQQVAAREASGASVESVADGYYAMYGGDVFIVSDRTIISSNNPGYVGSPASRVLSSDNVDNYDFLLGLAADHILTGSDGEGNFFGIRAIVDDNHAYIADASLATVFRARTATLAYNATFMLLILAVVFIVVRRLLRRIVVTPIHRANDTLGRITDGELFRRVDEHEVAEFDLLSSGINTTVTALKDTIAEVEHRNAQDLTAAKAIQESALPRAFPPFPDVDRFDIYASMKTAKEVGGDFYDFFIVDESRLCFLIADVSGKGIPASLFMMAAMTQIRTFMEAGLPVDEAIEAANHQLCIGNDSGMFVTVFACALDLGTGRLTYVNAGHNPPLLHHGGHWSWLRDVSGMPLGLFDGMPYSLLEQQLDEDDTLYLYTDGVTEAMDVDGRLFGEERLLETLEGYTGMNARSVCVGIRRALTDFTLDAEQSDDITMLALRFGVPPEKRAVMILPAETKQLVHVYNFIHEELHRRNAPHSVYSHLDIAAEELFVNVCHYAYPDATPDNPGEVRIGFEYEAAPPALIVTMSDNGIPYNPLEKPDAVTPDNIADVPIGGLGILMARQSVDDMTYERVDGSNILTFKKGW